MSGTFFPTLDSGKVHVSACETLARLVRYKAWANDLIFATLSGLPEEELLKPRPVRLGNMVRTLNHVYVVDDIFRHHLLGLEHGYTDRNTETTPTLTDLRAQVKAMDQWYIDLVDSWTDDDPGIVVHFTFLGGGAGMMTRQEIIFHLINHATYHRGFIGEMLFQVPCVPPASDLSVFIHEEERQPWLHYTPRTSSPAHIF